jgi:hypothetical protein
MAQNAVRIELGDSWRAAVNALGEWVDEVRESGAVSGGEIERVLAWAATHMRSYSAAVRVDGGYRLDCDTRGFFAGVNKQVNALRGSTAGECQQSDR